MPKVDGLNRVRATLQAFKKQAVEADTNVTVGFSQTYALPVHENTEASHAVGQAKYLEEPARRLQKELAEIARTVYIRTKSMVKGLLTAGLRLQREAQLLTPVDTSALKASAYTALVGEEDLKAQEAYANSEAIRRAVMSKRIKTAEKSKKKSKNK